MFAVIKAGGKQYRVTADDVISVAKVAGEPGDTLKLDQVLMVVDGEATHVGVPSVEGASIAAEIVSHGRGDKVIAFKKRRRQNSKRKRGHRQDFTLVRITEILTGGAEPSGKKAAAKPKAAKAKTGEEAAGEAKPARKAKSKAETAEAGTEEA